MHRQLPSWIKSRTRLITLNPHYQQHDCNLDQPLPPLNGGNDTMNSRSRGRGSFRRDHIHSSCKLVLAYNLAWTIFSTMNCYCIFCINCFFLSIIINTFVSNHFHFNRRKRCSKYSRVSQRQDDKNNKRIKSLVL